MELEEKENFLLGAVWLIESVAILPRIGMMPDGLQVKCFN